LEVKYVSEKKLSEASFPNGAWIELN